MRLFSIAIQLLLCIPSLSTPDVFVQPEMPFNRLVNETGGDVQFQALLNTISNRASSLRNGIKNNLNGCYQGYWGLVKKVTFDDGVKWAAKVSENKYLSRFLHGIDALHEIERY